MKILVCDDSKIVLSLIQFKLAHEGIGDITVVEDGREAKRLLKQQDFNLIITDIHMPFHSGLEIVSFVRQELKKTTPIIMLSAEGLEETVLEAFDLGVNDFITKPFSPSELTIRVKRLLN